MNEQQRLDADRAWRRHRRVIRLGQALMAAGAIVVALHWLTHVEVFGKEQPGLLIDLLAGYPMGVLILVVGAIVASRKYPGAR